MSCLSENLYMCIYMYMYILNNVIHVILLSYHTIIYVHIHKVSSKARYARCLTRFYAKQEAAPIINMCIIIIFIVIIMTNNKLLP